MVCDLYLRINCGTSDVGSTSTSDGKKFFFSDRVFFFFFLRKNKFKKTFFFKYGININKQVETTLLWDLFCIYDTVSNYCTSLLII